MLIREYVDADWPSVRPVFREVVAAGDTYAYDPAWSSEQARAMMRMPLGMKGCRVPEAANGGEAVEAASAHSSEIDPILMDLRMALMTGVEATRRIRDRAETSRRPIVAMSAHCEGD